MLCRMVVLGLLTLPPGAAFAADAASADCQPVQALIQGSATPELYTVAAGAGRVHFRRGGAAGSPCPDDSAACALPAFVVAGDPVVVTRTQDGEACATFTATGTGKGTGHTAPSTSGWLPLSALTPAAPETASQAASAWAGDWRSGDQQQIRITDRPGGRIALQGDATWGGDDPDRVKRGAVNVGEIAATIAPKAGRAAFALDDAGHVAAFNAAAPDCAVRLWRLGPYLVVGDNLRCGGNNVTFAGVYRRGP
jgi:hypothetical protein